jgi:hypothetical protein
MAKAPTPLKSVSQYLGIDPVADRQGYFNALDQSADARTQRQRTAADAAGPQLTDPGYGARQMANAFNRTQSDNANGPDGFNRDWVPLFESQNLQADINPGQKFQTNFSGLAGMSTPDTTSGGQPTGMPLAPSLRALAKQGRY